MPGMTSGRFASTPASASRTTCSTGTCTIAGVRFTREFHRLRDVTPELCVHRSGTKSSHGYDVPCNSARIASEKLVT